MAEWYLGYAGCLPQGKTKQKQTKKIHHASKKINQNER